MKQQKRTKEQMYPLVEAYLESSRTLTVKAFSSSHGIPESVFTYWLSKYRRQMTTDGAFVEVSPSSSVSSTPPLLELQYPNGVRLRMFVPVGASYLTSLVRTEGDCR